MNPFPEGYKLFLVPPKKGLKTFVWSFVSPSGTAIRLTAEQGTLLSVLLGRYGRPVLRNVLYDALWGEDPEGGPDAPEKVMDVQLSKIRKTCRSFGITFETKSNYDRNTSNRTLMLCDMRQIEPVGVPSREYIAFEEVEERRKKLEECGLLPPQHTVLAFVRKDREPLRIAPGMRA